MPKGPGRLAGLESWRGKVEEANRLYRLLPGLTGTTLQPCNLIPGWKFDPKMPTLVR